MWLQETNYATYKQKFFFLFFLLPITLSSDFLTIIIICSFDQHIMYAFTYILNKFDCQ